VKESDWKESSWLSNSDEARFAATEMHAFAAAIFYFCISKALGTVRFLTPFFNSGFYNHVISARVIMAICEVNRSRSKR
jgi:hypothetical protein